MNEFKKWLRRYKKRHEEYTGLIDTLLSDRLFPWDGTDQDMRLYLLGADSTRYPFPVTSCLFKNLREEYEKAAIRITTSEGTV